MVVVTGGAGFIGSHVVERLIGLGRRVVVIDDFRTGKRANLAPWADRARFGFAGTEPALEVLTVDVAEGIFAALAPVTARFGPVERVIHLAAQVSVVASVENPLVDVHVNYRGTVQVLEYARAAGVRKVAFASSSAVYGDVDELPVREATPCQPLSPYGIDKYASEKMLHYYSAVHGVPTTALRFFNVYGPRQDPSSPYSGVISIFADRGRDGRDLTIFGDGEQTRDFVYVGDVARAVVDAALGDAGDRAVLNVGTSREITINELATTIAGLCGRGSRIVHAPARSGEIVRSVAAVDRAREVLGFTAATSLTDGLRETLRSVGAMA
ncbi:MAG: NAD-dependent epimerase/dehydratase family protein [Kofleriaceae bacterium]|nr:NAD-dependent epimerase/dehydratase family protein [Kofleriaceae bacterium]MCB9574305.1 NAD-dependent epimerase/dehydratase family protein [Kofleriaceae bacterium]